VRAGRVPCRRPPVGRCTHGGAVRAPRDRGPCWAVRRWRLALSRP